MPEVVLYNLLQNSIKLIREDLKEKGANEQQTLLYRIMGLDENNNELKLNIYNFFKQARKIFEVKDNLRVYYGYNLSTTTGVDICILLPSENGKTATGADEGYQVTEENGQIQKYNTQTFECNYQLMITSNNSMEVLTIYTVLKSVLLMLIDQLELAGLRNPRFSGQDVVMQEDLTPVPLFHKVLNIEFLYEHIVPQMVRADFLKRIIAKGGMFLLTTDAAGGVNGEEPGVYAEIR